MRQELLFYKYSISDVVRARTEEVKKRVQSIAANTILNASEHDLIQALGDEFRLNVPVIKDEDIHIAHSGEARVDVSRDPTRIIPDRSRPFYVPGNQTVIAVPFEGDAQFFRFQPQSYSLNPPQAEIGKGELLLTYTGANLNAEAIKRDYQGTVSSIKDNLRSPVGIDRAVQQPTRGSCGCAS